MKRLVMYSLVVVMLFVALLVVARAGEMCVGVFIDPNEVVVPDDPVFLSDPNNQIRFHDCLRIGQKLHLDFTVCDPDGDPIGSVIPYLTSEDAAYTITNNQISLQYHARGKPKRDIIAFVLTDSPEDPNVISASRIVAIIVDVVKNNAPVCK